MAIDLSGLVHRTTRIVLGKESFTFTELTLTDMAEFRTHVRKTRKKANEERRARLLEDAKKIGNIDPVELLRITDVSMSEEEFQKQAETLEGINYLAYLSLRHKHVGICLSNVSDAITVARINEITEAMFPDDDESDIKKKSNSARRKKPSPKLPQ